MTSRIIELASRVLMGMKKISSSRIIKVKVGVIIPSQRLRLTNLTETSGYGNDQI